MAVRVSSRLLLLLLQLAVLGWALGYALCVLPSDASDRHGNATCPGVVVILI